MKQNAFRRIKSKLELSEEKTLITDVLSKPITFLGVKIRMRRKEGKLVNEVSPDMDRFEKKMNNLKSNIPLKENINKGQRKTRTEHNTSKRHK